MEFKCPGLSQEAVKKAMTVRVDLTTSANGRYSNLIVYVPLKESKFPKAMRGTFQEIDVKEVLPGTQLKSEVFNKATKKTRHGFEMVSLYIEDGQGGYSRVRCFARVRPCFPKERLMLVVAELNDRLDNCHPLTRDFDAEAVIAQDATRIINKTAEDFVAVMTAYPNLRKPNKDELANEIKFIPSQFELVDEMVPYGFNELQRPFQARD